MSDTTGTGPSGAGCAETGAVGAETGVAVRGAETGVARTALLVAAARAIETHRPDALARDPYAEHFVRAAGGCTGWPLHPDDVPGGEDDPLWGRLGRYFALRTRVLDDHLGHAAHSGERQVVLLGAGLDTRALRLPWPEGTVVYEIDQAPVLAFKQRVLDALPPVPGAAERRILAADVREDWAGPLKEAGFDPTQRTAWLAEGLFLYLPAAAEARILADLHAHSAPGSSLAYEIKLGLETAAVRDSPVYADTRERLGIDLLDLFDTEPRPDSASTLAALGWRTETRSPFAHSRALGRGPMPEKNDALAANRWVFALK
ncbi:MULTISPECIES: SAM-dependent methyltransferase [Streptomyces]|uniref:S-adenosyl-L-methionine-dependent methyltransferase n=1 Tax=Streptomyces evansiae TaxID=3075535 RepID=A0ABD5E6V5_9ACTN|nr:MULTISPECIES: SAM-dependent methyltransferase [unclassified Streptomyces]ASY34938.1 SAM-dependent methyltransferase [Streptomyces sp. CLI2509]MDT0417156.1 SAM-dependent methyltransferase [Streptomyces sp. DSM 41982]MYX21677.1 SAM-dependent methyltransferase [Streptomyces sp. SID8380]SCD93898.1 methyltransferase, TIGR00027 family [Streptomyces sp. SolWspMP-sol7th]